MRQRARPSRAWRPPPSIRRPPHRPLMISKKVSAPRPPQLVILEGNISAGKSSLSKSLGSLLGYEIFLEPTVTNPYLEKFYKDPKRYALRMQIWLLKQRYFTYITAVQHVLNQGGGIILDRSVWSDWVFAEKNRQDGNIPQEGFDYYLALREQMLRQLPVPHDMIYLEVEASECYNRVHNVRGRSCESGIPLEYLAGLGACYDAFVPHMESRGTRVHRVNWNSFGSVAEVANRLLSQPPVPLELWCPDMPALRRFVANDEAVARSTHLEPPSTLKALLDVEGGEAACKADAEMENRAEGIDERTSVKVN